jgi:hypothetical protein
MEDGHTLHMVAKPDRIASSSVIHDVVEEQPEATPATATTIPRVQRMAAAAANVQNGENHYPPRRVLHSHSRHHGLLSRHLQESSTSALAYMQHRLGIDITPDATTPLLLDSFTQRYQRTRQRLALLRHMTQPLTGSVNSNNHDNHDMNIILGETSPPVRPDVLSISSSSSENNRSMPTMSAANHERRPLHEDEQPLHQQPLDEHPHLVTEDIPPPVRAKRI